MTTYLSMNGTSDYLQIPSMTFDEIVFDWLPNQASNWDEYFQGSSTNIAFQDSNVGKDYYSSSIFSSVTINGTTVYSPLPTNNTTQIIPRNTRSTSDFKLINSTSIPIYVYRYYSSSGGFMKGNLYDIKFYNAGTLVAHYDMSTGTVNDQTGNGHNATLIGGTWVGGTGTTYIGSGTSQGTSSVTSNETLILIGSGTAQGKSNLTSAETFISVSTTYSGSGTVTGQSSLTSSDKIILSASGNVQGQSSLTSSEHSILSANGTAQGHSSLTSSETFIGATGTSYSASGSVTGKSNLTSSETFILKSSGVIQGYSSLTSQEHEILSASGTVQGQSNLSSSETFVLHATTTYSASGIVSGQSNLSSNENLSMGESGTIEGKSNLTSKETVLYFVTGITQGQSSLTSKETLISVEQIIQKITLNGDRQLYITLEGNRQLYITLKGGADVTAEGQNQSFYAGADYILDIPNITDNANNLNLTSCQKVWFIAKRGTSQIYKDLLSGVKVMSATDIQVSLKPSDTSGLYGGYNYEIWCQDSQGFESILTSGILTIKPSLTVS